MGKNADDVFPGIKELGLLEAIKRVWKTGNCERIPCALYSDSIRTEWRDNYIYKLASNEVVVVYEDVTHKKIKQIAFRIQLKSYETTKEDLEICLIILALVW